MRRASLMAFGLVFLLASVTAAENWAVVVGIDRYAKIRPNLNFCVSDAKLFQETLIQDAGFKPDHIKTLFNEEATKANIRQAILEWLAGHVRPGDKALFYFSGHGVQIRDGSGDEEDGYDEAIAAHDSWLIDTKFILDDEVSRWFARIPTTNKMVIFDSCHSGTGIRALDPDVQIREYYPETPIEVTVSRATDPADLKASTFPGTSLMAACDANQVALESKRLGHGVFTYYLTQSLKGDADADDDGRISLREATAATVNRIKANGWEQDPQLEGEPEDKYLVGEGELVEPYGTIIAVEQGNTFTLALGERDDVTPGSLYAVFSPDASSTEGVGKGLLEITEVGPKRSKAVPFDMQQTPQVGDKVVEYRHRPKFDNLRIRFEGVEALGNTSRIRTLDVKEAILQALAQHAHLEVVTDPDTPADRRLNVGLRRESGSRKYRLEASLDNLQTQQRGQKYTVPFAWSQLAKAVETLLSPKYLGGDLEGAYVLKRLSQLTNPANPPVRIDLNINKGPNSVYAIGDPLTVSVTVDRDCWLTLLDIGSSGRVAVFFPNQWEKDNFVRAGQTIRVPAVPDYLIQVGGPPGTETVKAIATLDPLNLEELSVEDLRTRFKILDAEASSSLSQKLTGKDLFLIQTDRWAETSVRFRVAPEKLYEQDRAVLEISVLE